MDYSLFAMFLLLLFGTTTWLLFRSLLTKVEEIERLTKISHEVLVIGEPVTKDIYEQVMKDRRDMTENMTEVRKWDRSE